MSVGAGRHISTTYTIDENGDQNYVQTYEVFITDPLNDTEEQVSTASGIPLFGDQYVNNSNAYCNGKSVSPAELGNTNLKRTVTATFTTKSGGRARSGNNLVTNPVLEPWKAGGNFAIGTRVTNIDKDDVPIRTTAMQPKSLEVPDGYDTVHVEGPSATMSLSQRAQAVLRCNSATIWGLTARQVFLAQWQWEELFHGNTPYFYHRLEFWVKYAGWNEVWMNEGTHSLDYDAIGGRVYHPIIPENDSMGSEMRPLDANGQVIPESALVDAGGIPLANPVPPIIYNTTKVIPEFDFTALTAAIGLPNPLPGNFV